MEKLIIVNEENEEDKEQQIKDNKENQIIITKSDMQMFCEHVEKCLSCERIEFLKEKNNVSEILKILEDLKYEI